MDQATESSQLADCDHIPIIDLSNLNSPRIEDRQKLAQSIRDVCTQVGFFYIKNHGIPETAISDIHNAAKRFFDLPEEQKMKLYIGHSPKFRGYSPLGGEKSTGTEDDPISDEDATSALSEAFDIGYETAMDLQKPKHDPLPYDPYELYGGNQWPDQEILPDFAVIYIKYCSIVLELCRKMMRIIALALDIPEEYFDSMVRDPGVTSRMMHYPPQPVKEEIREGLGAHTDFECFTILSQGSVPGLQVLNSSGEWILAPPLPGTLVVNIADCLSTLNAIPFRFSSESTIMPRLLFSQTLPRQINRPVGSLSRRASGFVRSCQKHMLGTRALVIKRDYTKRAKLYKPKLSFPTSKISVEFRPVCLSTSEVCKRRFPQPRIQPLKSNSLYCQVSVLYIMMSLPFSNPPSGVSLTPFSVAIPEEKLSLLKGFLDLARFAPPTYENLQTDRRYGVDTDWLVTMSNLWRNSYDWKSSEDRINTFPQFVTDIEGMTIHFVGLFSEKKDAVPLLLIHGWPGNFLEFLPILQKFREEYSPEALPYHLIVPSLPGYAFSSGPPLDKDFGTGDIARVLDQLMKDLGFGSGYIAQGGDIGSRIARHLAVDHESCKAVHLNVVFMRKPDGMTDDHLNASEIQGIQRMQQFMATGSGYATEHGTRTSTIGHVVSSSPIALLAWVGEKFLEWVDDPLSPEQILESITLYWLTDTFPRSIYTYRQNYPPPPIPASNDPRWYIKKPFGFSSFPKELAPLPRSWIDTTGNLVFWEQHPKGGHFAALEQPDALKSDLVKFVDQVWPGLKV